MKFSVVHHLLPLVAGILFMLCVDVHGHGLMHHMSKKYGHNVKLVGPGMMLAIAALLEGRHGRHLGLGHHHVHPGIFDGLHGKSVGHVGAGGTHVHHPPVVHSPGAHGSHSSSRHTVRGPGLSHGLLVGGRHVGSTYGKDLGTGNPIPLGAPHFGKQDLQVIAHHVYHDEYDHKDLRFL